MNIARIYLVENCFGDPNKVYIGKTKYSRESIHRRTFGSQITYTYIDEIEGCKKEDWKPLEIFWIEQFRQWGFKLMNKNEGGGGPISHTEETRQKMRHPKSSTSNMCGTKSNSCKPRSYFPKGLEHGNYGKLKPLRTQEHKKKISEAKKGKSLTHNKTWNGNISKGKTGTFTSKSKPIRITNIITNEIIIVRNVKEASKITGISASKIRNIIDKTSNLYKNFIFELSLIYL